MTSAPRPHRRTGKEVPCITCGKLVYRQKCHLTKKTFYCSIECMTTSATVHCAICSKAFRKPPSHIKKVKHGRFYCSRQCHDIGVHRFHSGANSPLFKGGYINPDGYHEYTGFRGKKQKAHRRIMEQLLGRKLRPSEIVHHENENKTDNAPSNLVIMTRAEHARLHHLGKPRPKKPIGEPFIYKRGRKFALRFRINGQLRHRGTFRTKREAIEAYEAMKRQVLSRPSERSASMRKTA